MNQQLKFAYGYVLAFISLAIIAYIVFVGLVYLSGGKMLVAAIIAGGLTLLLAALCVAVQRLKGTGHHFAQSLKKERLLIVVMALVCIVSMVPFSHFFTVLAEGESVTQQFTQVLDETQLMLTEYDNYAQQRIKNYRSTLRSVARGKKRGEVLDKYALGSVKGGDSIMVNNLVRAMQLQLSVDDDSLRQGASSWLHEARQGVTIWNVFLIGNVGKIRQAINLWHQSMAESASLTFPGEHIEESKTTTFGETHLKLIHEKLDEIQTSYSTLSFPRPLALILGPIAFLLLFLPYALQERNSRSRVNFRGGKGHGKTPLDTDHDYDNIHRIQLLNEVSIPMGPTGDSRPVTQLDLMRDQIADCDSQADTVDELMAQGTLTSGQLLQLIHQDCNLLDAATVAHCLEKGLFTREQLLEGNEFLEGFVDMLGTPMTDLLPADRHIESLDGGCTEFYFWGIPSSGKTCAIGAVLNAAREKTVANDVTVVGDCQGYDYLSELMQVFRGRDTYCVLPGRTPVDANFAMRLNMTDYKNRVHPVTLIDMAGELFCYLYWRARGITENCTTRHEIAFKSFENILVGNKTANRKFHFFIIEYGAEKKKYKGFTQDEYLTHGLRYLEQTGVLRDATDGVCVIVTKYDHLFTRITEDEDINNHLSDYLYRNYGGFLRLLRQYCASHEIQGGVMPDPVPFCIGDVCFRNYCRISTEYAKDIVKIILRESKGFRRDRFAQIQEKLRK